MAATGHAEEESYGPGEGSGVITISAKQLREKEDLMQYALEAQREVVEERKGSRRPNVIVSTLDIYDLTGGMCLDNNRLIAVRATLTPKRPRHDGSRGVMRSRRGRTSGPRSSRGSSSSRRALASSARASCSSARV